MLEPSDSAECLAYTKLAYEPVSYTHLSLRRFAHYDYWDNAIRPSILFDSCADLLIYGMGENQILEIARQMCIRDRVGVSRRVITSYETDNSRPRGIDGYKKLAEAFDVNINYLLSEDDAFVAEAAGKYGSRGAKQAQEILADVKGLFAGGEMAEEDMDVMMRAIQDAYWVAKENNKKFTPKKYLQGEKDK